MRITRYHGFLIAMFSLCLLPSFSNAQETDFLQTAYDIKENIAERLATCGTERFHPQDPRLPPPQITADEAYANLSRRWLAGYFDRAPTFGGQSFVYKWPNGGYVAWMDVTLDSDLTFYLANGGVQARMTKYFTNAGEQIYFVCHSQYVNESRFRTCVEESFVRPLLRAFCI